MLERWGHTVHVLGGHIYVFGGFGGLPCERPSKHRRVSQVSRCPLEALDQWEDIVLSADQSCPSPRQSHASENIDSHSILIFGGRSSPARPLQDCWRFDAKNQTWTRIEIITEEHVCIARWRHSLTRIAPNKFLVFGGRSADSVLGDFALLSFDETTLSMRWETVQVSGETPSSRFSHSAVFDDSNGILYIFGGLETLQCQTGSLDSCLYALDVQSMSCSKTDLAEISSIDLRAIPRFSHQALLIDKQLLLIGGITRDYRFDDMVSVDLETMTVSLPKISGSIPKFSWTLARHRVVASNGTLVVLGGGASCFSFGTSFNPIIKIHVEE